MLLRGLQPRHRDRCYSPRETSSPEKEGTIEPFTPPQTVAPSWHSGHCLYTMPLVHPPRLSATIPEVSGLLVPSPPHATVVNWQLLLLLLLSHFSHV